MMIILLCFNSKIFIGIIHLQLYLWLPYLVFPLWACLTPWHLIAIANSLHILDKLSCSCLNDFFLAATPSMFFYFFIFFILTKGIKSGHTGVALLPLLPWNEWSSWGGLCSCSLLRSSVSFSPSLCLFLFLPLWFVFSFHQDQCFHKAIGEKCYSIIALQGRSCVFNSWVLS